MEVETPTKGSCPPSSEKSLDSPSPTSKHTSETPENKEDKKNELSSDNEEKALVAQVELQKLVSELGKEGGGSSSSEEIGEWEFDELEKDLKASS